MGSITRAARSLGLSLPMASRHLRWLEKELGIALVHRTTRQLHLTDAGQEFATRARALLVGLDDAKQALRPGPSLVGTGRRHGAQRARNLPALLDHAGHRREASTPSRRAPARRSGGRSREGGRGPSDPCRSAAGSRLARGTGACDLQPGGLRRTELPHAERRHRLARGLGSGALGSPRLRPRRVELRNPGRAEVDQRWTARCAPTTL